MHGEKDQNLKIFLDFLLSVYTLWCICFHERPYRFFVTLEFKNFSVFELTFGESLRSRVGLKSKGWGENRRLFLVSITYILDLPRESSWWQESANFLVKITLESRDLRSLITSWHINEIPTIYRKRENVRWLSEFPLIFRSSFEHWVVEYSLLLILLASLVVVVVGHAWDVGFAEEKGVRLMMVLFPSSRVITIYVRLSSYKLGMKHSTTRTIFISPICPRVVMSGVKVKLLRHACSYALVML